MQALGRERPLGNAGGGTCASIRRIGGASTAQQAPTWSARVDRLSGTPFRA